MRSSSRDNLTRLSSLAIADLRHEWWRLEKILTSNSSVTEPRYITDIIYFADKEEDGEEREREISGTFRGNERRKIFHVGIGSEERAWKRQQDASVWERNSGRLGRRAGREWYTGQYYRAIRSQMPG